jgi:membrane protease subunit (stomatin/prohibitin family)
MLVNSFTTMLGSSKIAALDLAANYRTIGDQAIEDMQPEFQGYGLSLTRLVIENISVPPEVEKMMDARAQMGVVGDMGRYTQFQTAQAIPEAAKSGGAGEFMGMGAGIAMGQQMATVMAGGLTGQAAQPQQKAAAPAAAGATGKFCSECGKPTPPKAKFCPECGATIKGNCPNCGNPTAKDAKFCQDCGHKLK